MTDETVAVSTGIGADPSGLKGIVSDWSQDKQAWHDRWVGAYVVRRRKQELPAVRSLIDC